MRGMLSHDRQSQGTTGGDLPPEVIHLVVNEFDIDSTKQERERKRGLAACGLTCRHWAGAVRSLLFESLVLRSVEDVNLLLSFLATCSSIRPALSECIQILTIDQRGPQMRPWAHFIYRLTRRVNDLQIYMKVSNPGTVESMNTCQVLTHLPLRSSPRMLPGSMLPIQTIVLDNLRLRRRMDLVHFLRSFPTLEECTCRAITFVESSPLADTRHRASPTLSSVTLTECDDGNLDTQLALGSTVLDARERAQLPQAIWDNAIQMMYAVAPSSFTSGSVEFSEDDYWCSITAAKPCTVDVEVSLELFLHRPRDNDSLTYSLVKTVLIVLSKVNDDVPSALSWDSLEDILLQFPSSPNVIIDVHGAKPAFKWIMEAVLHSRILTKVSKVQFRYGSTDGSPDVAKDDILAAPTRFLIDGAVLTLNHLQQLEFLLCRRDRGKQETYLRQLLTSPDANVQRTNSAVYQDTVRTSSDTATPAFRALSAEDDASMAGAVPRI